MARLAEIAANATDKFVRVRWQVDEEHRQSVDREAIAALFAGSAELKVEARILPVVRSRAQGISLEATVDRKIERWCELTEVEAAPLLERFQLLEANDAESIAANVLARIDQLPAPDVSAPIVDENRSQNRDGETELQLPEATVQAVQTSQRSWLEDDLFAA
jgi:exonuclease SbcD